MPKHERKENAAREQSDRMYRSTPSREDELREHASRSSALLSARTASRDTANGASRRSVRSSNSQGPAPTHRDARQRVADEGRPSRQANSARPESLPAFIKRNIIYIASVTGVVLVVAIALFAFKSCKPFTPTASESGTSADNTPAFVSPYDWTKLDRTDGRYCYVVDGEVKSRLGIDVSEAQGQIDWQAVANDGIDFAMIRVAYRGATKGDLYVDEQYWANLEGALNAGLDCGAYFFSQADTVEEAREEADFMVDLLGGTKLTYPVAFDSEIVNIRSEESPTADLTPDEMSAISDAFCTRLEEAGYSTIIYGNLPDLSRFHHDTLAAKPVWWAEYNTPVPSANIVIDMWQYSNSGSIAGISTNVDMSLDLRGAL